MTRHAPKRPDQGFTLIEVMIAVLITAIAMAGIIGLYTSETRASGTARHSTEAAVLAQDQLERLRTTAAVSGSETGLTAAGAAGGIFDRAWTVTPIVGSYTDIAVTVTWPEEGYAVQPTVTLYGRRN